MPGLILGVVLAIQYHGQLAFTLTAHVGGATAGVAVAAPVSHASLISAPSPWCSELESEPSGRAPKRPTECSDFSSLASDILGSRISDALSEVLGQDVGTVAQVVRASLSDSPQELTALTADHR